METIYLILLGILFLFAFFDLIVGVSNDAVNFLNSAIGSKVAPRKVIFRVASAGVLIGAIFSSGMMEVARKGIFHPDMFMYRELMVIFLAVMITDVLLLDAYNTFKLPTSTTVSIVFELLGAAVAVSFWKVYIAGDALSRVVTYINSDKALVIITGILMSVAISFTVGAIIQWIVRYIFTFDYKKKIQKYGAVFGGLAITAITYFLLLKGLKGTGFISKDLYHTIKGNTSIIIGGLFVGRTILIQLLKMIWKIDILKIIVLVGTFALSMAFAGNDLVNFIGVPIAGFNAFNFFSATGDINMIMTEMVGKVPTPYFFLVLAGIVMVFTIFFSKKAKSVTETEIGLSRASVGNERFKASGVSRVLVRLALLFQKVIPAPMRSHVSRRFKNNITGYNKDAPAFDLLRASVNLTVASILIAIATSMKLPLSTTYVTFMVAMGTSLADGVWGRESAVFRITGVFTVIGGWFLTAISAFIGAALIATIIYFGGYLAVFGLVGFVGLVIWYTHGHHNKSVLETKKKDNFIYTSHDNLSMKANYYMINILTKAKDIFAHTIHHIEKEKRKDLDQDCSAAEGLRDETKILKTMVHSVFADLPDEAIEKGNRYVRVVLYLRKISHSLRDIAEDARTYISNGHPSLLSIQSIELHELHILIAGFIQQCLHAIQAENIDFINIQEQQEVVATTITKYKKSQLQRIKSNEVGVRNTTLYLSLLEEMENISIFLMKMMKSYEKLKKENRYS